MLLPHKTLIMMNTGTQNAADGRIFAVNFFEAVAEPLRKVFLLLYHVLYPKTDTDTCFHYRALPSSFPRQLCYTWVESHTLVVAP